MMLKNLSNLLKIKSIITLALTAGLLYGWVADKIPTEQFLPYVTMVVTFYFAKKDEKED